MSATAYDAVILGAGPAGATAALLLARAGWHVAIVEQSRFPRRKVCGEFLSATTWPLLHALGVADAYRAMAGPAVRRTGLYEADTDIAAPLPGSNDTTGAGRALGREHLDTLLLSAAVAAGAHCFQPWRAVALERVDEDWRCALASQDGTQTLCARRIILATGSWQRSPLFDPSAMPHRDADLFGFKAHFTNSTLPDGLMPLLVFPGGYGGMVHSDSGRVSISLCIRRDALRGLRVTYPGHAGEAVIAHAMQSCRAVARALAQAELQGRVLSAGPIRPGFRACYRDGIFAIGNSAGEAHPIIAEGIGMAMQSAWLLCRRLIAESGAAPDMAAIGAAYRRDWHRHFALRIHTAAVLANLALRPSLHGLPRLLLRRAPRLLSLCARLSGKVHHLPPSGLSIAEAVHSAPFTK
ncbi:MAG: FAD-dependent monooxygenase, partial [Rhizobiales bacterium]|nr:FAD-dependent monooxygenase [Hyphomicrobiales bacterium]